MSLRQTSVFRTRSLAEPVGTKKESSLDALISPSQLTELTKNEYFCVSRLPALPSVFDNQSILNAYSDYSSNYSIVVSENSIHVWNYKSIDATPLSIQFPIDTSANLLPLTILTRPSNGNSKDPGLVIIDSTTGLVNFYESVQHAPALGLINNKLLELTVPINSNRGEYITLAENIEPAGIAIATSWKRAILISLRDFKGKPKLSYLELLKPRNLGERIVSFFSGKFNDDSVISNDEIVSIKSGKISNNGLTQEIIVLDSGGGFNLFLYQLVSAHGNSFVDKNKSFLQSFVPHIKNSFDSFLPGSNLTIKFLDIVPINRYDDIYLGLCHVQESFGRSQNKNLILITIKIDSTGVLIYGSHKLLTYIPNENQSFNTKPKLFLPNPGKTVFVTVDNSVFITDIDTSYIESTSSVGYYKPRWEDVVRFKSSVDIIGYGYENASSQSNPAVIILTQNCGILRLERFSNEDNTINKETSDPLVLVKSHIDQAIFYSSSQEIDFDLVQTYSEDVTIKAIEQTVDEILNSSSPYMSEFLPAIGDSLSLKISLFKQLIDYCERNFKDVLPVILQKIVEPLEKSEVALNLWKVINEDKTHAERLRKLFKETIKNSKELNYESKEDVLRKFFSQDLEKILPILTTFIEKLVEGNVPMDMITNLVVQTQHNGVFLNEKKYISGKPIFSAYKLWIFDSELLIRIEELFIQEFNGNNSPLTLSEANQENVIKYVEVLYFYCTSAIMYMEQQGNDQLIPYKRWYAGQRQIWIKILLKYSLSEAAIAISEENRDFLSVAQVLDDKFKKIDERYGDQSHEMSELKDRYIYYFEKYGYAFASELYTYYLKNDDIQPIILQFTNYKKYLYQFFDANKEKVSKIAWIRYLLDENFALVTYSLLNNSNQDLEIENEDRKQAVVESLDNLELKYSLAKLSAIAVTGLESSVEECENNLIQIRIQKHLRDSILNIYRERELITLDKLSEQFNKKVDAIQAKQLIEPSFKKFKSNTLMNPVDLINYLTLLSSSIVGQNAYSYSLKLASLLPNDQQFQYYTKIIWLRLLTIGDDWSTIIKSNSATDDDTKTKKRVHDTVLFKTLTDVSENQICLDLLNEVLQTKMIIEGNGSNSPTKTINKDLSAKLNNLSKTGNFHSWIDSIQHEAKLTH